MSFDEPFKRGQRGSRIDPTLDDEGRPAEGPQESDPPSVAGEERRPPPVPPELLAPADRLTGQRDLRSAELPPMPPVEPEPVAFDPDEVALSAGAPAAGPGADKRVEVMRAFRAQFEPHLAAIAAVRRRGWQSAAIAMAVITLGVFVGARLLGGSLGLPGMAWVAPVLALIIGLPVGYLLANALYSRRVRRRLLPLLCEAIGGVAYKGNRRRGFDYATFLRLGLIDDRLRLRHLEDRFSGIYRGTDFDMMEAVYVPGRKENEETKRFQRGLLIRLSVPSPFEGTTILHAAADKIRPRRFSRLIGRQKFKPVSFGDPVFELRYQVRSDNEEEAHRLVAPALRNAMLGMTNERQGELVRGALHAGEFWMSVPVWRPLFEIASLTTSNKALEERVLRAADEITVVHRVIDQLHGSGPGRLL